MNLSVRTRARRPLLPALFKACLVLLALGPLASVLGRVGGGQGYGGGGGGGGGGDDGGAIAYLIFQLVRFLIYLTIEYPAVGIPLDIIVIGGFIFYFYRRRKRGRTTDWSSSTCADTSPAQMSPGFRPARNPQDIKRELMQLRRFDPNFSEIIFTDFCYALYGRAHHARGARSLDELSPYLSSDARAHLLARNPQNLREVLGVIVGAMRIANVSGLAGQMVQISVEFESNYTEIVGGGQSGSGGGTPSQMTYYVRELWHLERRRDVLSPPPAQMTALHCPRCGAALQKDTTGACAFCGARIESGEFQWFVRSIILLGREERGPLLTSNVPEVGTDNPSVVQPSFAQVRAYFEKNHPEFNWGEFQTRARMIFDELQAAWSTLDWERARPHETDSIFQMHRYWIDAYRRQNLRNMLDQCRVTSMQPVKIMEDAFYNSITLRIWAEGYDYTVDSQGRVVAGSNKNLRRWSEYWTFIRHRDAKPQRARTDLSCPNCGAGLKVNATGICEFCGGKITSGEFDWVLSKIEQDESYAG